MPGKVIRRGRAAGPQPAPAHQGPPQASQDLPAMTAGMHEKPSEQFINGGLGFSLIITLCVTAAAGHLPFAVSWITETVIFTGAFTGMTLWKRNRWGWLWTCYVVAVSLADAIAHLIGVSTSQASGGWLWAAGVMTGIGWICMLYLKRNHKPAQLPVQHVTVHHVIHGMPEGIQPPGTVTPGEVVQVPDLPAVTAPLRPRAIGAPRTGDSLGRRLAGKVPVKIVRK